MQTKPGSAIRISEPLHGPNRHQNGEPEPETSLRMVSGSFAVLVAVLAASVCVTRFYSYLMFHSLVEIFTVAVACSLFFLVWNARRFLDNHYLLLVGIASLFSGVFDLLHALAYKGMGVFGNAGADLPTQLWISGRYLQSAALLAAPFFVRRRLNHRLAFSGLLAVCLGVGGLIAGGLFPACYVEGTGLTAFKVNSEYAIVLLLLGSAAALWKKRGDFEGGVFRLLFSSTLLTVASELAFTRYTDVYGWANMVGHLFRFVAFCLLYRAIIFTGLVRPNLLLFRSLSRSEADLRKSESRLRALGDNLPEAAIFQCRQEADGRAHVDFVSAGIEGLTGMPAADLMADAAAMKPDTEPEDFGRLAAAMARSRETLRPFEVEIRHRHRVSGETRWTLLRSIPARSPNGSTVWDGIGLDITGRKQADEALRESEERYRRLFDSLLDAFVVGEILLDGEGRPCDWRYLEVNAAFERMFGRARDEMAGRTHRELFPDSAWDYWVPALGEVALSGVPARLDRYSAARDRHYEAIAYSPRHGQFAAIFTDVTERVRADQALRLSEEKFARAFAANPAGLVLARLDDGLILDTNETWLAMFGYRRDEVVGHPVTSLNYFPTSEARERSVKQVLEAGSYRGWEQTVLKKSGEPVVTMSSAELLMVGGEKLALSAWLDISARKSAEEALRDSEEKLRSAFANAAIGFALTTPDGRYIDANPAYCKLCGYSLGELRAAVFPELIHPEDRAHNLDLIGAMLGGDVADFVVENRYVRKDGATVWVRESVSLVRDAGGAAKWVIALVEDVTGRKLQEEALRDSEEQFRSLANAIPQLCWMSNAEGWISWYNQRWYDYTGAAPGEMERSGWQSVHDPDVLPEALARLSRSLATGEPFDMVLPMRGADGVFRPFLTRAMPVRARDGKVVRWFGTATDISDQRRNEDTLKRQAEEIRRSNAVLEAFFDASPGILSIADEEFRYIRTDRLTPRYFGLTRDELVGRSASELAPEFTRECGPVMRHVIATGEARLGVEVRIPAPGRHGEASCWLASFFPVPLPRDKRGVGIMGVDITGLKKAEERLRQAQKLESIGMLAGGIAHDFNNLLTSVMGNASLLLMEELRPGQAELAQSITESAERAAHLTRQLLAYSGKGQFVVRDLDASDAVNGMADLMQFSIPKSVSLSLHLERRLPPVTMDPGQLQQILMNLVINAGEAMGEGRPGRITVATSMVDLRQPHANAAGDEVPPGRYVCIEVGDTGSGIEPENQAAIFDPFFTTKFMGRGLGLAAVAGIVRSLKGAITLESVRGKGSTFRVLLPAAASGMGKPAETAADERATILVVDDEGQVRDFICSALRKRGYRVLSASDGQEALALCHGAGTIDAAIVDVVMPNMAANDLLEALKAALPGVRILLTSGYSESEARRLCSAYPAATFIQKPYTARQLDKAVSDLLTAESAM
jgi:PAS domain S-box-containing protein